jgi:hypothetical protein
MSQKEQHIIDEHGCVDIDMVRGIRGMLIEEIDYFHEQLQKTEADSAEAITFQEIIKEKLQFIKDMESRVMKQMNASMDKEFNVTS